MTDYHNFGTSSTPTTYQVADEAAHRQPERAGAGGETLLVNRCISQQSKKENPVTALHIWPRAVKLERDYKRKSDTPVGGERGEICSFSAASKRRLRFTASNAFPELISQFALTYHNRQPDGRMVKAHLNAFLVSLRRRFPDLRYLWILEFQTRGTAHFHLFLSLPHTTPGLQMFMAEKWHNIAEPDSAEHLRFHLHPYNFIAWDMGSGAYLCKYLDKEHQKAVPANFSGVGRFWGNSRGIVPPALEVSTEALDDAFGSEAVNPQTGEVLQEEFRASIFIVRTMCKHHEKQLKRSRWKSSARKRPTSYTLPSAAPIYRQLERFLLPF